MPGALSFGAARTLQARRSPCESGAAKLAGIWGLNVQDVGAAQTGMSVPEFKAMLLGQAETKGSVQ